jgi:adenosine kinase
MSLLITGSIATDHLMTFPGKFADSLMAEKLDKISVSFLASNLEVRRGGVAANIAFSLAKLGESPVLVGAVGEDFAEYHSWLDRHGVDCSFVHYSETQHTARFTCTTDTEMNQIASFYPGAMGEAREIELKPIADRVGEPTFVLIGANDPDAMLRHTNECRERGYRFVADPSQQLAFAGGDLIRPLIEGADILISNEYEAELITTKTGWTAEEVLSKVGTWVTTLGKDGVRVQTKDGDLLEVGVLDGVVPVEPTGVGDAFRGGLLAALAYGLGWERAAQLGCTVAAYVVETVGTQEYDATRDEILTRLGGTYGADAEKEIRAALGA